VEHPVGEDVAALRIGAELGLVEGDEGEVALHRHGFGGAQEPARVPGQDLLLAGDQGDPILALHPHHPVVDLARQQPQREADHPARMRRHPLDGEMGLAGIGGPKDGGQRRPGEFAHDA
jgi:hypothetical protein